MRSADLRWWTREVANPTGAVTDYTANVGTTEDNYEPNPEAEDLVRDNGLLHHN